jgi:hypothetical protein
MIQVKDSPLSIPKSAQVHDTKNRHGTKGHENNTNTYSMSDKKSDERQYDPDSFSEKNSALLNQHDNWARQNKKQSYGQQDISSYLKNQLIEDFNSHKKEEIIRQLNDADNNAFTVIDEYIDRIKECYENEDPRCSSDTDPKSNYFNQAWDTVFLMDVFLQLNDITDEEKQAFAMKLSDTENDWVREKNLEILATMPPNINNLETSVKTVASSSDPSIYRMFVSNASKQYADNSEATDEIADFFIQTIKNGGFFLGKEAATMVLEFMTPSTIKKFNGLLGELNTTSYRYIALKQTIEEYYKAHPITH